MPSTLGEKYGRPWRYQCSDCESHAVTERVGDGRSHKREYASGDGVVEAQADREKRFYCMVCEDRYRVVYDKKTGSEVENVS